MLNGHTFTYIDAVLSLVPLAKFYPSETGRFEDVNWVDDRQMPSSQAVVDELARLIKQYNDNEYQRLRAPKYPPIGDQLDALWKGGQAAADMLAQVQAVKAQFPKPAQE